jgi:hypothetical protein
MLALIQELIATLYRTPDQRFLKFTLFYLAAGLISVSVGFFGYYLLGQLPEVSFFPLQYDLGLYPDRPFSEGTIKDPKLLIQHIATDKNALSEKIYSSLSEHTRELAAKPDLTSDQSEELQHLLLYELNALLGTHDILDVDLYKGMDLPGRLVATIAGSAGFKLNQRIRLARLLLSAVYPDAISNRQLTRWDCWSLSALILTIAFSFLFERDCYKDNGRPALFGSIATDPQYKITWLIKSATGAVFCAALAVFFHAAVLKLFFIALFFFIWCRIDSIIALNHTNQKIREEFKSLFWYIDFPFLIGLMVLFCFYLYLNPPTLNELLHLTLPTLNDPEAEAFFAGAVAFKVILQNTNFLAVVLRSFNETGRT